MCICLGRYGLVLSEDGCRPAPTSRTSGPQPMPGCSPCRSPGRLGDFCPWEEEIWQQARIQKARPDVASEHANTNCQSPGADC
jgi:hypothetical protein